MCDYPIKSHKIIHDMSHMLSFVGKNGILVTIDLNTGNITYGENYTPDEAARVFWETIGNFRKNM